MGAFTLGEALVGALGRTRLRRPARSGAPHRTGAPVLADSMEEGTFEDSFFVVPAPSETDRLLRAARRALDAGKRLRRDARAEGRALTAPERLLASLTAGTLRVFEELLTLARLNRGRVFPSYDHLADATGLGRATVARAIAVLDRVGFLVRQRRFKRLDGEGPGPRYKQTSNVYRAFLPKFILSFLPRWMRPAPVPLCEIQREADRCEEQGAMLASLSCRELAEATIGGQLGKMLAKLGAGIDAREREYQNDPQPLTQLYNHGVSGAGLVGQQQFA